MQFCPFDTGVGMPTDNQVEIRESFGERHVMLIATVGEQDGDIAS